MHPILTSISAGNASGQVPPTVIYPLTDLAVFEAVGSDALTFIQGQITNDVLNSGADQAKLAGYCTAQGRLLATMVVAKLPDASVIALIKQNILAAMLKRLGMFILRAKVKLNPSTYSVVGVSTQVSGVATLGDRLGHTLPQTPWQMTVAHTGVWICAPQGDQQSHRDSQRWWWLASQSHASVCEKLALPYQLARTEQWQSQDISAGLPWIEAATQDLWIPQTLNLDLIEGISFTKGCYPGQEIVARSHYRGTVKRRMHLGAIERHKNADVYAGMDIFDAQGSEQACGRIVNIVSGAPAQDEAISQNADAETAVVLFETSFEALEHGRLHVGARDGVPIKMLGLPYSLTSA
jgi:folate-binding protein YgfZ